MGINVISTKRACEILKEHGMDTNPLKLGLGLQQRVYPFGVAIKSHQWIYEIYDTLLMKWIEEREQDEPKTSISTADGMAG